MRALPISCSCPPRSIWIRRAVIDPRGKCMSTFCSIRVTLATCTQRTRPFSSARKRWPLANSLVTSRNPMCIRPSCTATSWGNSSSISPGSFSLASPSLRGGRRRRARSSRSSGGSNGVEISGLQRPQHATANGVYALLVGQLSHDRPVFQQLAEGGTRSQAGRARE